MFATSTDYKEIFDLLIFNWVDIIAKNMEKATAFIEAAINGLKEVFELPTKNMPILSKRWRFLSYALKRGKGDFNDLLRSLNAEI